MKTERKLPPQPAVTIDPESGRKQYEGSLSSSVGLTTQNRNLILRELLDGTRMPADLLAATGLSQYNAHHQESIQRMLIDLTKAGEAEQVRDDNGRLLGWRHTAYKAKEK